MLAPYRNPAGYARRSRLVSAENCLLRWYSEFGHTALVIAGLLFFSGCSKKSEPAAGATNASAPSGNPLTAPVDYLGTIAKAQQTAVKTVDLVSVRKAIELFYAQEDRYPQDLNELVTQRYLRSLPALPAGMRYQYNPQNGQLQAIKQ